MAEIKSTMEMVLERAARMEQEAGGPVAVDYSRDGMRIGVAYMNGNTPDIMAALMAEEQEKRESLRHGILQVLLRNVILPRDEDQQASGTKALQGLIDISGGHEEVANLCNELQQILGQYGQHKDQMTEQLEEALKGQLQQQHAAQGNHVETHQLSASAHPQYNTELTKMLGDLNDQYLQAMDQRKEVIQQAFGL